MQVQLIFTNENRQSQVIPINLPTFVIGRAEDCNLRLRHPEFSRYHCSIQMDSDTLKVQDLGGENGTFVNGHRITGVHDLKNGDKLGVGRHVFTVSVRAKAEPSEANKKDFFELPPSGIIPPQSHSNSVAGEPKTSVAQQSNQNKPEQDAEIMFEVRLDGQRISVTKNRLFDMARKGAVLPDDLVTIAGTKVFADSIQGIVFGEQSIAPPPPPPPSRTPTPPRDSDKQKPPAPVAATPIATTHVAENAPFPFSDLGDIASESSPFDNLTAEPVARIVRRESTFGALWNALDISFSRVYTMEGNNLAIHALKAFYYVVAISCLITIFLFWLRVGIQCHEAGDTWAAEFAKEAFTGSLVTIGCIMIIVIVRILIEMLLLTWLESAAQEEQESEKRK